MLSLPNKSVQIYDCQQGYINIAYFENLNSSFPKSDSDTDNEHEGYAIILQPPVERPDAVTDEDSDDDDTNDINHLPRRILIAESSIGGAVRAPSM